MLIQRRNVEKILALALNDINTNSVAKKGFIKTIKDKGFTTGEAKSMLSGNNPLIQMTDELIYLLVIACNENTTDASIKYKLDPTKILTEKEIDIVKNIKVKRKSDSIFPITFENVNFDMEDDYSTVLTIERLSELFDNRVIKYNTATQRPLISKWYQGEEVKDVFVNAKNRKAIEKNIESGKQVPNYITLNILENGLESFEYNSDKRTLTITQGEIDLLDGFHRTLAARNVFQKNPSIQFAFKIRIVHWDVSKAKAFIHQETLGTQLDPLARKTYDVYNDVNKVVNKLNESPKSFLRNKIAKDVSNYNSSDSIIMFDVVFDTIKNLFNVNDNKDVIMVSNHITNVLEGVIGYNINAFDKKLDERDFILYMLLAKQTFGKENSEVENFVSEVLSNIDIKAIRSIEYRKVSNLVINNIKSEIEKVVI